MKTLVLIALLASGVAHSSATGVRVGDNYYRHSTVRIHRGGAVKWHWVGHRRHDVYFTSGRHRPARCSARRSGSCSRRFRHRGTFSYVCTLHGDMAGRVIVR